MEVHGCIPTLAQYSVIVAIYPITYREFLHCVRKLSYNSTEDKNRAFKDY